MRWPWQAKRTKPLCAQMCGRRATHVVLAGNLIAFVDPICAGEALKQDPRIRVKALETYQP